ncbi:response regulator transcription factor [Methylophilus sp. 5]|uniref:response regulator n=1 Tax=Methylophilus sp. 5 TaxID=1112274 RepID=UPI00048DF079|nr:response regulator transcription factor [Methylophilus sp. 5]
MKLLLVEDDHMIGESLQQAMRSHAIYWVQNAMQAEAALASEQFDAMLLDLGLPGKSGMALLQSLRQADNRVPVIIITARDAIEHRIQGLDAGADDYVLKPFSVEEIEARLRAIFRRKEERHSNQVRVNDMVLDTASYTLTMGEISQRLSSKTFAIMHSLMSQPGMIFSKTQLEERLYGWGDEVESNAVEVHIHTIRKKFGADIIQTIRGIGYAINEKKES